MQADVRQIPCVPCGTQTILKTGVVKMAGDMSIKTLAAGLVLCGALAACEKDVILQGERFAVRTPLAESVPVDGQPAPVAPSDQPENASVPIAVGSAQSLGEWSHRGGSARHTAPNASLSAAPVRVFSVNIGSGNSKRQRVSASPVVSGGRVFAMDSGTRLTAVSTSGALQWTADLTADFDRGGDVSGGGLAVQGGRVFATTGFGELVALDAGSGAVLWRQRLDAPLTGAPAVDGNAVYAVGRDGSAAAVAVDTGRILWQVPGTPSASGMIGASSPAIGDTEVYFPFASGEIAAVGKGGGERAWGAAVAGKRLGRAYAIVGDITGDPVVVGGTIYAGTAAGRTVALDAASGETVWNVGEGALNPPLVVGGSVFVVNDENRLVRLDAGSGEVIWAVDMPYWTTDKPRKRKGIVAQFGPVLAGGRLVVASGDGQLRLFDPTSGALVGGAEIPGGAASSVALAGGVLYVVGGNGQLHAFR